MKPKLSGIPVQVSVYSFTECFGILNDFFNVSTILN